MKAVLRTVATIAVAAAAVTACTSTDAATTPSRAPSTSRMTPGMVMPDGSTMGATQAAATPSPQARMICSADIRTELAEALSMQTLPKPRATWAPPTYTCRYQLPSGPLVLSVTESSDDAAAKAHAGHVRTRLGATHAVAGLTDTAFANDTGTVVVVKDSDTLAVDATGLPARFGKDGQRRNDFAYEVASVVLGCWTGD